MSQRPVIGICLAGVAVVHLACTPLFYAKEWSAIAADGFVNALTTIDRQVAFWYVVAGLGVVISAVLAGLFERRAGRLPAVAGAVLLLVMIFGGLLMPAGGFWLFVVPTVIIFWQSARSTRTAAHASSAAAATGSAATAEPVQ